MNKKLYGRIIYLFPKEAKDYRYKESTLSDYYVQELKGGVIADFPKESMKKINFVIKRSPDEYGGSVKGFIYPDGKILGHFHYTVDASMPKEWVSGGFKKIKGGYEIRGKFYDMEKLLVHFYLRLIKPVF